jgi:hypothetical protein
MSSAFLGAGVSALFAVFVMGWPLELPHLLLGAMLAPLLVLLGASKYRILVDLLRVSVIYDDEPDTPCNYASLILSIEETPSVLRKDRFSFEIDLAEQGVEVLASDKTRSLRMKNKSGEYVHFMYCSRHDSNVVVKRLEELAKFACEKASAAVNSPALLDNNVNLYRKAD